MPWTSAETWYDPTWAGDSSTTSPTYTSLDDTTIPWYQLSVVSDTDTSYGLGVDFQLKASEQFPVKASTSYPLKIVESAYSRGLP